MCSWLYNQSRFVRLEIDMKETIDENHRRQTDVVASTLHTMLDSASLGFGAHFDFAKNWPERTNHIVVAVSRP